jgi:hypothetical protein
MGCVFAYSTEVIQNLESKFSLHVTSAMPLPENPPTQFPARSLKRGLRNEELIQRNCFLPERAVDFLPQWVSTTILPPALFSSIV